MTLTRDEKRRSYLRDVNGQRIAKFTSFGVGEFERLDQSMVEQRGRVRMIEIMRVDRVASKDV